MQAARRNVQSCCVLDKPLESNMVTTTLHGREARYIRQDVSLVWHVLLQKVQLTHDTTYSYRRMEACRLNLTNS